MRKNIIALCSTLILLLVTWLPCHAQEAGNNASLNDVFQQLQDMGDYGIQYSSQYKSYGEDKATEEEPVVDIYVNCSTGKDKPSWGLSPEKPFETINYAISQVPFIRESTYFFTNIQGNDIGDVHKKVRNYD